MTEPTAEQVTRLLELEKKATPGPWGVGYCDLSGQLLGASDRELIKAMRAVLPDLADSWIERMKQLAAIETELRKPPLNPSNPNNLIGLIRDLQQGAMSAAELESQLSTERKRVILLEQELLCAAQSLISYEHSYGYGGGIEQAFDIAKTCGYEGDPDEEEVSEWIRSRLAEKEPA